jgi:Spy/CpxP family protein refolding chaperone
MIKKFIKICALAASFLVFVAPTAQADHHCGCGKIAHKMHEAIEKLNLTTEQKDKIKAIHAKSHESIQAKRHEMKNLEMMVNASFQDGSMTEAKIDEFVNKKMHIVGAVMKVRMMERFEISKILTAEQKQKLNDMLHHKINHASNCLPS